MSEKKKPGLGMVAVVEKGKPSFGGDDDEAPESSDYSEEYQAACDELADVLGVPEEKREAFCDAMRGVIAAAK